MIDIIISGEGISDVGYNNMSNEFVFGPITYLTQQILYFLNKSELNFYFKSRKELKHYPMTLRGKKKEDKLYTSAKGHANLAYKLACIANESKYSMAILMRDTDKRKFEDVYGEIKEGFRIAQFENGIPAVPVPKSEAWLICCIESYRSENIENCKKEMKKLLKEILFEKGMEHNNDTWSEIAINCKIEEIIAPSFIKYVDDLKAKSLYLF